MVYSNRLIIPIKEFFVDGTINLWYNPTPTPPTTLPINAPKTGTGINI